jgi:diguanylate cyclase
VKTAPKAVPAPSADALRLDAALRLLQRAGHDLGDGPRDTAWLQRMLDALCDLSSRDPLTGLANRRQFEVALERECDRVARSGESALVLLLDVDHFKRVNDAHGHGAGDLVLQAVARCLQGCVRPMDTVARYGGEEFAVVLPNCAPAFARTVAERVRRQIAALHIPVGAGTELQITVSVGGAFAPPWVRSSARLWTERADAQLYRAKAEGRNRICLEPQAVSLVSAEEKGLLFAVTAPAALDADVLHPEPT